MSNVPQSNYQDIPADELKELMDEMTASRACGALAVFAFNAMLLAKYGSQASEQTKNHMPLPEMLEVTIT